MRGDGTAFLDPGSGRWWMGYSWTTNSPPTNDWEKANHGSHVGVTELDSANPFTVRCDANVAQIYVANSRDDALLAKLAKTCPRCGEMLSNTKAADGTDLMRDGLVWGVAEGVSIFRHHDYLYAIISGSAWDSPYYHAYWVAAKSMEELAWDNPNRVVGRLLIPSQGNAFGHGSAVLGPDGETWYYVHHRLKAAACCARDVWVTPIEFIDKGDGLGPVHIAPRFPSEDPAVTVRVPAP
jgi:hypothetical protein